MLLSFDGDGPCQSLFALMSNRQGHLRQRTVREVFKALFGQYGLPKRIRSDNGAPFASIGVGGLSRLSAWWVRLGILPERIEPGKPQQNGRHERMHRTLKQETLRPPAASAQAQQRRFDHFRERYNEVRPHESLKQCPEPKEGPVSRTLRVRLRVGAAAGRAETRSASDSRRVFIASCPDARLRDNGKPR